NVTSRSHAEGAVQNPQIDDVAADDDAERLTDDGVACECAAIQREVAARAVLKPEARAACTTVVPEHEDVGKRESVGADVSDLNPLWVTPICPAHNVA